MKPNKENMRKWVEALESGEYTQTKEMLRNDEGYCCLGVVCDVYAKENKSETAWSKLDTGGPKAPHEFMDKTGIREGYGLTRGVFNWLFDQASEFDPIEVGVRIKGSSTKVDVIALNDELDYDFKKIAKALRDEYLRDEDDNG